MSSNLKVNTILPSTGSNIGIGTNGGELVVDGGCKVQVGTALTLGHSIGLQFATQNLHSAGFEINQINASGIITASQFKGDGSQLTGITGTTINNNAANRVITGEGGTTLNGEANLTFSGSLLSVTGNISLPDSTAPDYVGNIYVGNNSDLKIFHNGSDNFIRSGAGNAKIRIDNNSGVLGARFIPAGAAELYHNGSKKIETTNTGATVTGNLQFASAGQGIDFSASTHASGKQSELLDDYERGSWTPQFFNARTGGTQLTNPSNTQANYVKVGRIVYLHLGVHGLTKNWAGSNTQIFIRGLPYRSYFQHNGHCVRVGYFGGGSMGNDDMNVYANLRQYDTYMELQKSGGAQGRYEALYWSDIHWEGYGNLTCEMVYETDQGV